jgi:hypothetical protein
MVSPSGPLPPSRHVRFSADKLYGDAADVFASWLKMRCVDGIVPGGAAGLVISGKAGCGKLSAVRWAMRRAELDPRALTVFYPWSSESAAGIEREMVMAAMTAGAGAVAKANALPYRVLVMRHAELWALRSMAREESSGAATPSSASRSTNTFAYWAKLMSRSKDPTRLPRVAIILLFNDLSLPKTRALVGKKAEDPDDPQSSASPGRTKRKTTGAWKHIDLDGAMISKLPELAARMARFIGSAQPMPFDGDLRAFFRRREDPFRRSTGADLDMNYNIFRASERLLSGTPIGPAEVRSAVDADTRLVHMLWVHSVSRVASPADPWVDRDVWSGLDASGILRREPGWASLEWRLCRVGAPNSVQPLRFEMERSFRTAPARRASVTSSDLAASAIAVISSDGYPFKFPRPSSSTTSTTRG